MSIKSRIALFIKEKHLTQSDIADSLKMNQSSINKMINTGIVTEKNVLLLKLVYHLNPDWLLHGKEPMYLDPPKPSYQDPAQTELNQTYESLSEEAKKRLLELAKKEQEKEEERKRKIEEMKKKDRAMLNNRITVEKMVPVPIVGRVTAGVPSMNLEYPDGYIDFPSHTVVDQKRFFCLHVDGDSMIDCRMHHGDIILVEKDSEHRNGDIVVAKIDEETTVKKIRVLRDHNIIELIPCNPNYETIKKKLDEVNILGVVVAIDWRRKR